jgi:hypothetical protein
MSDGAAGVKAAAQVSERAAMMSFIVVWKVLKCVVL